MNRAVQDVISLPMDEFLELTSDAVVSLDHKMNIAVFNSAAERLFEYTSEEVMGKPLDLLLPEESRAAHPRKIEGFRAASETARPMSLRSTVSAISKTGRKLTLGISIHRHSVGSAHHFTALCRDLSANIEISKVLEYSEARLARAQAIAHLGNWEWNITTGDLAWTDEIYNIFGLRPQEFEATYEAFLKTIHPDDRQRVSNAVNDTVENDTPYSIVHRIICPDGKEKVVQELGEVLRDEDGRPLRMDGIVQDITKDWQTREALVQATRKARKADEAKSRFLASMSHELRTPLNAILGFAQILRADIRNPLSVEQVEHCDYIIEGGDHLLKLVNRTLDLAKIDAGQLDLSLDEVHANEVVEDCVAMTTPLGRSRQISVIDEFSYGPSVNLHTDHLRFNQIMVNLIANAIKYNKNQGSVTIKGHKTDDGFLHISVSDTGIGIAEEDRADMFQMFHRIKMTDRPAVEGTGIGLATTKILVENLSGRIGFESEVGVGSTFWIDLPLVPAEQTITRETASIHSN